MSSIEILQAKSVFLLIQSKENTLLGMNTYTIPKTVLHVALFLFSNIFLLYPYIQHENFRMK